MARGERISRSLRHGAAAASTILAPSVPASVVQAMASFDASFGVDIGHIVNTFPCARSLDRRVHLYHDWPRVTIDSGLGSKRNRCYPEPLGYLTLMMLADPVLAQRHGADVRARLDVAEWRHLLVHYDAVMSEHFLALGPLRTEGMAQGISSIEELRRILLEAALGRSEGVWGFLRHHAIDALAPVAAELSRLEDPKQIYSAVHTIMRDVYGWPDAVGSFVGSDQTIMNIDAGLMRMGFVEEADDLPERAAALAAEMVSLDSPMMIRMLNPSALLVDMKSLDPEYLRRHEAIDPRITQARIARLVHHEKFALVDALADAESIPVATTARQAIAAVRSILRQPARFMIPQHHGKLSEASQLACSIPCELDVLVQLRAALPDADWHFASACFSDKQDVLIDAVFADQQSGKLLSVAFQHTINMHKRSPKQRAHMVGDAIGAASGNAALAAEITDLVKALSLKSVGSMNKAVSSNIEPHENHRWPATWSTEGGGNVIVPHAVQKSHLNSQLAQPLPALFTAPCDHNQVSWRDERRTGSRIVVCDDCGAAPLAIEPLHRFVPAVELDAADDVPGTYLRQERARDLRLKRVPMASYDALVARDGVLSPQEAAAMLDAVIRQQAGRSNAARPRRLRA